MSVVPAAEPVAVARAAVDQHEAVPARDEVTLVEGASFCVSDRAGDIEPDRPQGVFYRDTRIVSAWRLLVDDEPVQALAVVPGEPFGARFVTRAAARPGQDDSTVVVERRRLVADGMREDLLVTNHGTEPAGLTLQLLVDADFADLFDVKDGRPGRRGAVRRRDDGDAVTLEAGHGTRRRGVRVRGHGARAHPGALWWRVVVPPRGTWRTTVEVLPSTDEGEVDASFPVDRPVEQADPSRRMRAWRRERPEVRCADPRLRDAVRRSVLDLGALRISDPVLPGADVVAAGAPWFMALFGRDSLLTSALALPFDPDLAVGTLQTLAAHQGRRVDPLSEEEPGRILHEVRRGDEERALGGSAVYYGSVDATPLFVVVLDLAARWGVPLEDVCALLPAADAALEWVERYGDRDGDGFVEYQRSTDRGLLHQGWKDSHDAISFADGRPAAGPVALVEVQAYVHGAYRARAHLASLLGDEAGARTWAERAERLRAAVDDAFWLPDRGYYALALDGRKEPVDALASNQGHCLWTGLATGERAAQVAEHLLGPALFTGWGVRTLATTAARYNPVSYHNGSVWPHDNALVLAGLVRAGLLDHAHRLAEGLLDAAAAFGGRLPELFCGFDRGDVPVPVPYPTSCSPQAWAAASPLGLLTALLRLDPCVPHGRRVARPALPASWGPVEVQGLPLGDDRWDVAGPDDGATGACAGLLTC
ncbi:amylo-alpha-1,6-glucosidase [Cellulomonas telluris]|uniref:amylo-alpha-1,6-glucosidase n=1 Tax=Cellulomonas telluris TaxID=2306636 RepID=UPI0010A7AD00|nr:glycogen debranching N-terminal domain-containing protein [Cellulomonas telluris]